jgi:hypothetical protein
MPKLVNTNSHPVRATDADGRRVRLVPGQVMQVDGELADLLTAYSGVETASSEQSEAWEAEAARRNGAVNETDAGKQSLDRAVTELRSAARMVGVAVPLNTVIGDDDAPLGPPSGTITTKQAVARQDEEHNKAFGNRERMPEDRDLNLSPVEQLQAEAVARLESVHNEILEDAKEGGNEAATVDPPSATNSAQAEGGDDEEKPKRQGRKRKGSQSAGEPGADAEPS